MDLPPWASFLGVVLAIALFLVSTLHHHLQNPSRKYNLPPGPRPWPVIGNLNLIGPLPHQSVHELSKRYGPLMSLRFGSLPVVVGSSVDMARFFLKTHDLVFIDRPRTASGRYTGYNYSDMLWSPYGAYWRQARKFCKAEVFSAARLRSQEHAREGEVRAMLRDLYAAAAGPAAAPVRLMDHLFQLTINVISLMVLGKKHAVGVDVDGRSAAAGGLLATTEAFKWMIEEFFFLSGGLDIGDMIPWLSWLDPHGHVRRMKRLREMFDRFLDDVVDEHSERRRRAGDKFVATDAVDLLLELADDPNLEVPIERDGVKAFTLNLLVGLPDTTSVTIEWAMSELLRNPDALATATEELDRVIGRERLVTEGDIASLPYMEAVVKETMRLHPVSPMLAPRLSREDVSVSGHDIPAGTLVFVNVWAIARDPAVWGQAAGEFRPERFVGSGVDVKGHDLELLPFGSGRRMCPGVSLGLRMVQVILANLVQGYAWKLPDGVSREELSMEETFGLSTPRMVRLDAVAEPRLPAHLYAGP
ncbi:trimethyltridecatetraene synthase-like isoform X1 [Miscanthus floridulus]|uniref:trimethyltridecatetraene synthase-like isoform X1 n=1 Tax=Miscanthus floridulus TaxID=154761 RepID=UPI00345AD82C